MSAQVEVAHRSTHGRRVQINVRTIALVFACATLWITMRAVMQATGAAPSRASIALVLVLAVAQPLLILGIRFV